ncbi:MAG TPA: DMT family transporter [Herpetosiphonaceae bacterium]
MAERTRSIISLLAAMALWGSTFAVTKSSLDEVPPLSFAALRFIIASALLLGAAQWRGGLGRLPQPIPWRRLALLGLTGVSLYFVGFNLALTYTSAAQAALIQSSIPAATAGLAALALGDRPSRRGVAGIGLSMAGVAAMVLAAAPSAQASDPLLGNLLMFGTVAVWAVYTVLAKQLAGADPLAVTAYSTAIGLIGLLAAAAIELAAGAAKPLANMLAPGVVLSALYLGALPSAGAYLLWNNALRTMGASQASVFINLVPLVGVATAAVFLGERPGVAQLAGGAVVLLGVWLSSSGDARAG